ncbi:MAG TPA: hypothetical protein VFX02_00490 [Gammaproteobacteria bacterium]|nr:hypothetical protein [Gammaproteobacteria bacterium]
MRTLLITLIVLLQFNLHGCAGEPPVTAETFRKGVPESERESFEVSHTLYGVAGTFKRKTAECLNTTITSQSGTQKVVTRWNPSFTATPDNAELQLRRAQNASEQGQLIMVVDITPTSPKKTRIDIYKSGVPDVILRTIRKWALGKDIGGCPDMMETIAP